MTTQQVVMYRGTPSNPLPPAPLGWALCPHEDDYARKRAAEVKAASHAGTMGALPLYGYRDEMLDSGIYRFFRWERAIGGDAVSALKLIGRDKAIEQGRAQGMPDPEGEMLAATMGYTPDYTVTDAGILPVDPKVAATACTGTWSPNASDATANAEADEIYKLGVGQERTFIWAGALWKQTNMAGGGTLYRCSAFDTTKIDPSTGSAPSSTTMSTTTKWILGAAVGAVIVGGILYAIM